MNRLEYKFICLDGYYNLSIDIDDQLSFVVDTNIDELVTKSGVIDKNEFINKFNELDFKSWDRYYNATLSSIEDATKWSLIYIEDDKVYESEGEESYEPYRYYDLIDALCIVDDNAKYLKFMD